MRFLFVVLVVAACGVDSVGFVDSIDADVAGARPRLVSGVDALDGADAVVLARDSSLPVDASGGGGGGGGTSSTDTGAGGVGGAAGTAPPACAPVVEICDGKDNDCDGVVDNGGACPLLTSSTYQGHTYGMSFPGQSWLSAQALCRSMGYELAVVETAEEWVWLKTWLAMYQDGGSVRDVWVGLHRDSVNDPWKWVNGAPVTFTAWSDGQPNNFTGDEFCTSIRMSTMAWGDRPCHSDSGATASILCESVSRE